MVSVISDCNDGTFGSTDEETELVQFLFLCRDDAGSIANFNQSVFEAAAAELSEHSPNNGAMKSAEYCRGKWHRASRTFFLSFVIITLHSSRNHMKSLSNLKNCLESFMTTSMVSL
jgi:hypothetical protein